VVNTYDYMNRRVRKEVFNHNGTTWETTAETDLKFVYDQWNVLAVLDGTDSDETIYQYCWGPDMNNTIHGASGIGGLLAVYDRTTPSTPLSYLFMYDGIGNVTQLVEDDDWDPVAHYEYDAYGNIVNATGSYKDDNPFRFSTKYYDAETGFSMYPARSYTSRLGRWLNRDPAEESGGLNLYAFVINNPVNNTDPLGLWEADTHQGRTKWWALSEGMRWFAARKVGREDIRTDGLISSEWSMEHIPLTVVGIVDGAAGLGTGFSPLTGDQSRHFNRNNGEPDTRREHQDAELQLAIDACHQGYSGRVGQFVDNQYVYVPGTVFGSHVAAVHLGRSLHSLQDWWAHGDFEKGTGNTFHIHSKEYDTWGLDAVGVFNGVAALPNGRAPQVLVRTFSFWTGNPVTKEVDWPRALWVPGQMRERDRTRIEESNKIFLDAIRYNRSE
jgi:RHS repeat-associated protein